MAALSATKNSGTPSASFAGDRSDIYPVNVQFIPGNGHTGLPDRDEIMEMYPAVRNAVPRELTWLMTDGVIKDFFWLRTGAPGKQRKSTPPATTTASWSRPAATSPTRRFCLTVV
jgi:hypothetical protein